MAMGQTFKQIEYSGQPSILVDDWDASKPSLAYTTVGILFDRGGVQALLMKAGI